MDIYLLGLVAIALLVIILLIVYLTSKVNDLEKETLSMASRLQEAAQQSGSTLDVPTGKRFREAILEAGGSRPAMDSFKAFRGREPDLSALLRHQGMAVQPA